MWRINGVACSMNSLSRHVLELQQACVFVHVGMVRATAPKLAAHLVPAVVRILEQHEQVTAFELELNDPPTRKAILNATQRCTKSGQMMGTLFAEIERAAANKFQDQASVRKHPQPSWFRTVRST